MKILPKAKYRITTKLEDDEVVRRLVRNLEDKKVRTRGSLMQRLFIHPEEHKKIEGRIYNYHFKLNRIVYDSFLYQTTMSGRIRQRENLCEIEFEIRFSGGVNAALLFLIAVIMGLMFVASAYGLLSGDFGAYVWSILLISIGFFVFTVYRFNRNAQKDLDFMTDLCDV